MENKSYYISVGEPWDFVGPDGKNIIKGEILKVFDINCVLFKANHKLRIKDVEGDLLILSSRYKKDDHFNGNDNKLDWTINVGLILTNNYEEMNKDDLKEKSKFVIIGSLESGEPRKN
ncbi:hypothetical protein [Leptospira santarosai]|uniref:Uncharacterized protein n=1 Tax=Leptospira santarosai serovar Shermani str. LT 821 TaxID=758847 RepID=K8YEJ5_9LEPT|nr:hypothetical protein [Leptospira santarosai]EKT87845.1 hypothetical protein LSS_05753 [Leptospira santarosai serovar Shermani str. LT 821]EPG84398.1 hypothetical protein LEP1GSC048_3377 [Leptospira santarosai serovar Shermani str. 1342KT]